MTIRLLLLLVALMALGVTTVFAAKPSDPDHNVVAMSNGFPSGPHFNLNIHGKKANFICPQGPYGGSVFIPEYQSDFSGTPTTIEYVASKGKDVSGLTVLDACAQAFDEFDGGTDPETGEQIILPGNNKPVRVQLPKTGKYEDGFWVFARALGKPNNSKTDGEPSNIMFVPDPALRVCDDFTFDFDGDGVADECPSPDSDLVALGLVTNKGVYKLTEKGLTRWDQESTSKGKGKSTAKDITGLFMWTGYVCPASLDVASNPDGPFDGAPDGTIDEFDVPNDQDGDGVIGPDDLAIYLAALCEFHNNEWVFNIADLVVQDQDIINDGVKLVQIRFYPVATTKFTPSAPDVTTEIHRVIDGVHVDVTGGTVEPGTTVHDKVILTAGTGPTPTESVTFSRFDNGTCTGDPESMETVLLAAGMAESAEYTIPAGVHAISYRVYYGGDNNYLDATGVCEPLAVGLSSLVTTEIHDLAHNLVTMVAAGTTVHDSAMVTGSGPVPTGSVDFTFYIDGDCTPSVSEVDAGSVALDGLGLAHPSQPQGPLAAGNYSFKALYNGDPAYFPAWSACEPLKVVDISLTQATDTNLPGTSHTVTATVTDGAGPVEGVTVLFEVIASSLNPGADGLCSANVDCTTDASGEVSFTYPDASDGPYPGTDTITACVDIDAVAGTCDTVVASDSVVKTWTLTLVVGNASGAPGDQVILPITLSSAGTTVPAALVTLTFDGTMLTGSTGGRGSQLPAAWSFASNSPTSGELRSLALDIEAGIGQPFNGEIFTVTFTIDAGAMPGSVPVTAVVEVRDDLGSVVSLTVINGVVTVL